MSFEIKPPPASRRMSEQQKRQLAIPVYRTLKAWHEGPKQAGTWAELVAEAGLFNVDEALTAVYWMRSKGVAVAVSPGQSVGEPAVVTLIERLPEAFEVSTFPHGLDRAP